MQRSVVSGVVFATLFLAVSLAGAAPASATTVCVVGTANTAPCPAGQGPGGAFTLTSTNFTFAISGGGNLTCTSSTIAGTAPATAALVVNTLVTLRFTGCSYFGFAATLVPATACDASGAAAVQMGFSNAKWTREDIPATCTITMSVAATNCIVTVNGVQTIGNSTAGAGGQAWVNGAGAGSTDTFTNSTVTTVASNGLGVGCPTAITTHSGTISATYRVTAPATAPGVTLQ